MILETLPQVQKLPARQKRQLAEELLRTTDGTDDARVAPALVKLLNRRLAEYDAQPHGGSDFSRRSSIAAS